jgi:hypothetical protein
LPAHIRVHWARVLDGPLSRSWLQEVAWL